jgi:hypothetical protein
LHLSLAEVDRIGRKPEVELLALDDALKEWQRPIRNTVALSSCVFLGFDDRRNSPGDGTVTRNHGTVLEFCSRLVRREIAA